MLRQLLVAGETHLADLGSLRFLVLDEADRMVQAGHFQVGPTLSLLAVACTVRLLSLQQRPRQQALAAFDNSIALLSFSLEQLQC